MSWLWHGINLISGCDALFSKGITRLISSFMFVLHMKDREGRKPYPVVFHICVPYPWGWRGSCSPWWPPFSDTGQCQLSWRKLLTVEDPASPTHVQTYSCGRQKMWLREFESPNVAISEQIKTWEHTSWAGWWSAVPVLLDSGPHWGPGTAPRHGCWCRNDRRCCAPRKAISWPPVWGGGSLLQSSALPSSLCWW